MESSSSERQSITSLENCQKQQTLHTSQEEIYQKANQNISRRIFLGAGFSAIAGLLISSELSATTLSFSDKLRIPFQFYPETHIERLTIRLERLPESFVGYRIAFLTDLHYGHAISRQYLENIVSEVQSHNPDLILLGGDFLWIPDSSLSRSIPVLRNEELTLSLSYQRALDMIYAHIREIFATLHATDGILAVSGNHDLWHMSAKQLVSALGKNIHYLNNESRIIERKGSFLEVVGVEDYWSSSPHLPATNGLCRLLLCHNPDFAAEFFQLDPDQSYDFAFCGHTHGGQMKLPLFGAYTYNINSESSLGHGLWKSPKGHTGLTSSGIGVVELPWRLNCPPEVHIVELASAEPAQN